MDLEEQGRIQKLVEAGEKDRMIAVLGMPSPGATRMVAMTLQDGDPSFAGPLAGVPLGLPVYHVLEEQIKACVDPAVYEREIGPMELVLDAEQVAAALAGVRGE
jgi:glycine/sarcosine/betaine reductase complex component A